MRPGVLFVYRQQAAWSLAGRSFHDVASEFTKVGAAVRKWSCTTAILRKLSSGPRGRREGSCCDTSVQLYGVHDGNRGCPLGAGHLLRVGLIRGSILCPTERPVERQVFAAPQHLRKRRIGADLQRRAVVAGWACRKVLLLFLLPQGDAIRQFRCGTVSIGVIRCAVGACAHIYIDAEVINPRARFGLESNLVFIAIQFTPRDRINAPEPAQLPTGRVAH